MRPVPVPGLAEGWQRGSRKQAGAVHRAVSGRGRFRGHSTSTTCTRYPAVSSCLPRSIALSCVPRTASRTTLSFSAHILGNQPRLVRPVSQRLPQLEPFEDVRVNVEGPRHVIARCEFFSAALANPRVDPQERPPDHPTPPQAWPAAPRPSAVHEDGHVPVSVNRHATTTDSRSSLSEHRC